MRHAKTEPWAEGIEDHSRALTSVGHRAAQLIASELDRQAWRPQNALVSTARRTRESWVHLAEVFPSCRVSIQDELYLAGERQIMERIQQAGTDDTVMVLGHNPGLHDLCVRLMREAGFADHQSAMRLSTKLPPGAAAQYEADQAGDFHPARYRLVGFLRPKDLI